MSDDFGNVSEALGVLHSAMDPIIRDQAQSYLLSVQRSPSLSCQHIASWLSSPNPTLQLFAAQSMQVKVSRGWNGMDGDEREGWAGFGTSLLDGLCTGSLTVLPAARQKLFQSIVVLMMCSYPVQWTNPIEDLLDRLHQASSQGSTSTLLLDILALLPEEAERYAFTADQRYKWFHVLKGSYEKLTECFSLIQSEDQRLLESKFKCLASWIKFGLPIDRVTGEINQALGLLSLDRDAFIEPVVELLVEVASLPGLSRAQSLGLIPILLQILGPIDPSEPIDESIVKLFVSYAEAHCDDLFNALLEGDKSSEQFLVAFLTLTGAPGYFIIDEEYSDSTLQTWCLLHDLAIDEGLPASPLVSSLFSSLVQALLRKSMLPDADQWNSLTRDRKSAFEQYRRDLADAMLYCLRVLGPAVYQLIAEGLVPDAPWRFIESRLWAFLAIAEEIQDPHPILSSLLAALPSLAADNTRTRAHALRLFGALSNHGRLPDGTVNLLLGELVSNNVESSIEAARALYQINEEAPEVLIAHIESLIECMGADLRPQAMTLLCRTIGSLFSSEDDKQLLDLSYLEKAINKFGHLSPDSPKLVYLSALIRSVRLSNLPASQSIVDVITAGMMQYHTISSPAQENVRELFETLVLACGPTEQAGPSIQALLSALVQPTTGLIDLLTTVLCVFGPSNPDLVYTSLSPLIGSPQDDDDYYEALLTCIAKVAPKCCDALQRLPIENLMIWSNNRLASSAVSTPLLRAIIKFHTSLLGLPEESLHWLESLYAQNGPTLLQASLFAACNLMPRSQVESTGRLIFELFQKFPQPSRQWIHQILSMPEFPSPKYSAEEKAAFARNMAACRSVGKAKQLFTDFVKH